MKKYSGIICVLMLACGFAVLWFSRAAGVPTGGAGANNPHYFHTEELQFGPNRSAGIVVAPSIISGETIKLAWVFQNTGTEFNILELVSPTIVLNAARHPNGDPGQFDVFAGTYVFADPNRFSFLEIGLGDPGENDNIEIGGRIHNLDREFELLYRDNTPLGFILKILGKAKEFYVNGEIFLGDDGTTDHTHINASGDLSFVGGAGMQIGEIYYHDVGFTVDLPAQDTDYQITGFDTSGVGNDSVAPDHTNDHITLGKAGWYGLSYSADVSSMQPNLYEFHIMYNNGTVDVGNTHALRHVMVAGKIGPVPLPTVFGFFPENATVELWVRRNTGGAAPKTITIERINLTVVQYAG